MFLEILDSVNPKSMRLLMKKREQIGNEGKRQIVYDTEADKSRLRNIRHDNKQDIDFWKKIMYN